MSTGDRSRDELLVELSDLRSRVTRLEAIQAEQAQTEEKYRSLLEACPDAVVMSDLAGKVLFASQQTWSLLRLSDEVDLRGHRVVDYVVPEDRERLASNIALLVEQGVRRHIEYQALGQDGSSIPVEVSSAVIRDSEGDAKAVMAVIRDITGRKQVEEALRQSHGELRAIYDAVVDGITVVDIETKECLWANEQMARMLGYSLEELPRAVEKVGPRGEMRAVEEKFRAQQEGRMPVAEDIPFVHRDGSLVYTDISGRRMEYRGRPCLISFVRDVTRRKRAEAALRASEERFRDIFEEAPVGILLSDKTRKITHINRAIWRMIGCEPDELIGRYVQEFLPPEDRELSAPLFDQLLAGEIPSFTVERRWVRKNGETFWAQAKITAIRQMDGQLDYLLGIIEDIDERKRARASLEREHHALTHMLQSSDHERRLIAYEIHDGLAQQLAAAVMRFESHEQFRDRDPAGARTAYDAGVQMLRQAHHEARRLISGVRPPILDHSGIVAALAQLVQEQSSSGQPSIELESDVRFVRLAPILENAIYRIAQESLANACKYSQSARVRVRLYQEGQQVHLEVRDWGIGFDPDQVGEDSFGLEGIRERVRLLGGAMSLESHREEGTSIRVALPLFDCEKQQSQAAPDLEGQ